MINKYGQTSPIFWSNVPDILPEKVASELPLHAERYQLSSMIVYGGQPFLGVATRLKGPLNIGRYAVEDPYVTWMPNIPGRYSIGMEILSKFVVGIDTTNKTVRFRHAGGDTITIPNQKRMDVTVGVFRNSARITSVTPRLQAKADLKVGDEVISINGTNVRNTVDSELYSAWRKNAALTFRVRRDGQEHETQTPALEDAFSK